MTISIDELSRLAGEELRIREERERALRDPFKRKRSEPRRALPHHGSRRAFRPNPSLRGKHS